MTADEKYRLKRRLMLRERWTTQKLSAENILRAVVAVALIVGAIFVAYLKDDIAEFASDMELSTPVSDAIFSYPVQCYLTVSAASLAILCLYPFGKRAAEDALQSIGFVNHTGCWPKLVRKRQDAENPRVTVWEFLCQGIPLVTWENKKPEIESALNITITKIKYSKGKTRIQVYAVPATDLPDRVEWRDEFLTQGSGFELALGVGHMGVVSYDASVVPHCLIAGGTGSGKSVLLKLLLMQALKKGALVYIADLKGGIDFGAAWRDQCRIVTDEQAVLETLNELVDELERRKGYFLCANCCNLDEYNEVTGEQLQRIIFGCDEVAELLDQTGCSKEHKELIVQIESKLCSISRVGRALGIHVFLATQRPDRAVLPGQISNNIDLRICGRCDNVLAQMVLNNTDAAALVPKDAQGRFVTNDGTVFQAYWFDDRKM